MKSHTSRGDFYGGQWPPQAFAAVGISYVDASMDKSTAFLEIEPLFAEGRIDLLDHPQLVKEFKMLERRLRAGGKALVEHPREDATTTRRSRMRRSCPADC